MRRALVVALALLAAAPAMARPVVVCSKKFTESVILGEAVTQLLRAAGVAATHRAQLGSTRVVWSALEAGECDVYPEYTGTLAADLFPGEPPDALAAALERRGLVLGAPLGFADSYGLGLRADRARTLGVTRISDLAAHPGLRYGFSEEFGKRADGWPGLCARYQLPPDAPRTLDHDLAYRGLVDGALDVVDVYTTDAEIVRDQLTVLADDRGYFRDYAARLVWRRDLAARAPAAPAALARLDGRIDVRQMAAANARARIDRVPEPRVAAELLAAVGLAANADGARRDSWLRALGRRTVEHLVLVGVSLALAIVVSLPLGILAARRRRLGQWILGAAGVLQTIPSLALLVVLIPLFGIGAPPALAALFVYSTLPIIRNTYAGLTDLPASIRESAEALGLSRRTRLRRIELPMASRAILAGVKTAAVIDVGTATLGAIIGAGGYGEPILTGVRLADVGLILQGALPAALMALAVQALFDGLERIIVPRGLRLPPAA